MGLYLVSHTWALKFVPPPPPYGRASTCADPRATGKDFCRIGVGIGRPEGRDSDTVSEYVLGKMTAREKEALEKTSLPKVIAELKNISGLP